MKIEKSSHLISGTLRTITQNFVRTVMGISVATVFISNPVSASNSVSIGHAQTLPEASQALKMNWKNVRTQEITTGGITFAYRELGKHNNGTPIVFLAHLAAVLDNWDPRIMDGIAAKHHVIAFDNRGIGASTGKPSNSIEQMADDATAFIKAKGFKKVDLLGFSMGGMVALLDVNYPDRSASTILAGGSGE